ncbi:hypothetical protein XPA_002738 [Xanthoria parietina]
MARLSLEAPLHLALVFLNMVASVNILASEEERIEILRNVGKHLAERMGIDGSQIFIRYKHELSDSSWVYEYATALPYHTGKKRKADGTSCSTLSHHRWLYSGDHARH